MSGGREGKKSDITFLTNWERNRAERERKRENRRRKEDGKVEETRCEVERELMEENAEIGIKLWNRRHLSQGWQKFAIAHLPIG